ncbi:predicted protein [Histoplasma capsulatum G186AR]|uniref:Uncharacterized protein n=1 Tax=Ajellomyces capsulatus (strain G186AR / H82 / ATCC MYA-2454 / RMSCC 2432) TaxID=447093 RepID=C0NUP8_AJECG|nr:uncharacterized protein HCBG_06662 [Histoplasma capsulatum G186AR]EEH04711.1 predicted protein [Histoplasma capsulatum G186AR]
MAAQMIYLTDVPEIQGDTTWEDDFYTDFCIAVRYLNLRTGHCPYLITVSNGMEWMKGMKLSWVFKTSTGISSKLRAWIVQTKHNASSIDDLTLQSISIVAASDMEYSVERDIENFFEKTSATRTACDDHAKQHVGGDVIPVVVQGLDI